ncbi:MAG: hypothetical protein FWE91_06075 [Defluviitaleaceae bacterium]|nr:hypothetical protein [Defluviitaleaceae bacterium]MCL2835400.1 hypothetical protein [Defluviitaleaceae bacterium]
MQELVKKEISIEDKKDFRRKGIILNVLMLAALISAFPLHRFGGYIGLGIWGLIAVINIIYAYRVQKIKKSYDLHNYKEISEFIECKK